MKVLTTGANGQLGRAIYGILKTENVTLVSTDYVIPEMETLFPIQFLDITDEDAVMELIQREKPDIIINCAAHTQVDLCETEEEKAYQINAAGPRNLAKAARSVDAKLVQVSTDYVFEGNGQKPYVESDPTNPVSAYGRTKLAGEEAVQKEWDKVFIVRTAWLYGDGKNFVKTMLNLSENYKEIRVVNDQYGTPTTALELAKMIWFIVQTERYGIYHATCEGSTSWYEFAKEIFKAFGKEVTVHPVTTAEYNAKAARPAYSVLENHKLNTETEYRMKDWQAALNDYVAWSINKGGC